LGCGFDTLYFRLRDTAHQVKNFIELDFPTVTARKCYTIKRNKALLARIHDEDGEVRLSPTDLHGPSYHLMGVDLRNLDEVDNKLQQAEVDYSLPTIFLAECVLVYIEAQNCRNLLKWIATLLSSIDSCSCFQTRNKPRKGKQGFWDSRPSQELFVNKD